MFNLNGPDLIVRVVCSKGLKLPKLQAFKEFSVHGAVYLEYLVHSSIDPNQMLAHQSCLGHFKRCINGPLVG